MGWLERCLRASTAPAFTAAWWAALLLETSVASWHAAVFTVNSWLECTQPTSSGISWASSAA